MAQFGPSRRRARRSAYQHIPDIRRRMSRFGQKADDVLEGAEGRSLTRRRHSIVRLRRQNGGILLRDGQITQPVQWSSIAPGFTYDLENRPPRV